jgi:hypothetical protein
LVVEDATIHVPMLGLIDLHHYFDLASRDGEFFFILATNDPDVVLLDADGNPGVRRVT